MLKKIIFILLVAIGSLKGQISFPEAGADWQYKVATYASPSATPTYSLTEVKHIRDTIFMGRQTKVLSTPYYYNRSSPWGGNTYIYSGNDSVFIYNSRTLNQWQLLYSFSTPEDSSWQLLYEDFNMLGGIGIDTITVKVDSVRTTVINSLPLKTLYVTYTQIYHAIGTVYVYPSVIYEKFGDQLYLFNFISGISLVSIPSSEIEGLVCYADSTMATYPFNSSMNCTIGMDEQEENDAKIVISPNPTSGSFTIRTNVSGNQVLNLYDLTGKLIFSQTIVDASIITIPHLNSGLYNLSIKTDSRVVNKKLIIMD